MVETKAYKMPSVLLPVSRYQPCSVQWIRLKPTRFVGIDGRT